LRETEDKEADLICSVRCLLAADRRARAHTRVLYSYPLRHTKTKKITTPVYTSTTLYKKFHSILSLPVFAAAEGFFGTAKLLPPPPLRTAGTLEERDDLAELEDLA
jgi:hypothetical protein